MLVSLERHRTLRPEVTAAALSRVKPKNNPVPAPSEPYRALTSCLGAIPRPVIFSSPDPSPDLARSRVARGTREEQRTRPRRLTVRISFAPVVARWRNTTETRHPETLLGGSTEERLILPIARGRKGCFSASRSSFSHDTWAEIVLAPFAVPHFPQTRTEASREALDSLLTLVRGAPVRIARGWIQPWCLLARCFPFVSVGFA